MMDVLFWLTVWMIVSLVVGIAIGFVIRVAGNDRSEKPPTGNPLHQVRWPRPRRRPF